MNLRLILIIFAMITVTSFCSCKKDTNVSLTKGISNKVHYNYEYQDLLKEFTSDYVEANNKLTNSLILVKGEITGIEYPVCKNEANPCVIYMGREGYHYGPEQNDFVMIEMSEYVDKYEIGKIVEISAYYKTSYNEDVIAIVLERGIIHK